MSHPLVRSHRACGNPAFLSRVHQLIEQQGAFLYPLTLQRIQQSFFQYSIQSLRFLFSIIIVSFAFS